MTDLVSKADGTVAAARGEVVYDDIAAVSQPACVPSNGPSVAVAKDFMHADMRKTAHKSKEGRADHKRGLSEWAEGKRNTP